MRRMAGDNEGGCAFFLGNRYIIYRPKFEEHVLYIRTCGVRSVDVKSTEVNAEKGLKTRRFQELVFFLLLDFFVYGLLLPSKIEG